MTSTKTSPRTDAGNARLRASIRALVRRFQISERADVSCCDMTIAQAAMLEVLRLEGALRLGAISSRLGVSASTLSRNFARLEERGWVQREVDPQDRRAWVAKLTSAGQSAAKRVEEQELEFAGQILERMPVRDRRVVVEGLDLLLRAVRDASQSCCGDAFDHLMRDFPRPRRDRGDER